MSGTENTRKSKSGPTTPQGTDQPFIPDKLYFRIGEVARLLDLPAYVLRFWESEFPQLKPNKGGTGQRLYRRRDVETVREIKHLLYNEGYTIPGARQFLKTRTATEASAQPSPAAEPVPLAAEESDGLRKLRSQLYEIAGILSRPASPADNRQGPRGHASHRRRSQPDTPPPLFAVPMRENDGN